MPKFIRNAVRPLRRRSGSVLILVVALLVLLALMGTAFISTSRNERGTSAQNSANTEAELLLQGLVQATAASTVGDLYGQSAGTSTTFYRPPTVDVGTGSTTATTFNSYTSAAGTLFLADRVPVLNGASYQWPQISWPLFINSSTGKYQFDNPLSTTSSAPFFPDPTAIALKNQTAGNTIGSLTTSAGQVLPAITIAGTQFVAGDTDGDGIADAGLFKLPVSPVDGITYYGAIRVLDGNSAVNANTALCGSADFNLTGTPNSCDAQGGVVGTSPLGYFPSSVSLLGLLTDYSSSSNIASDFARVATYLFDQQICPIPCTGNTTTNLTLATPVNDSQVQRTDFNFTVLGEVLSSQLARRLNNPGYFNVSGTAYPFTPFSLPNSAALASGFCIKSSSTSNSDIETWMPDSLLSFAGASVDTSPYGASNTAGWYSANFDYAAETGSIGASPRMPLRALLTTWNPVADYIPQHYVTRTAVANAVNSAVTETKIQPISAGMLPYDPDIMPSTGAVTAVSPGQFVKYKNPAIANAPYRCYECLTATKDTPLDGTGTLRYAEWREEPWTDTPTKANINTADFPTLWRAFYNVMADSSLTTPSSNGDSIPPVPVPAPATPTAISYNSSVLSDLTKIGWGPFRDPTRVPPAAGNVVATVNINAGEMLQMRAGIAAVNAIDMRSSSTDITSRSFTVCSDVAQTSPQFTATVYGCKPQPYIVTVVADYDGSADPQVSIELYNPTDDVITMTNWQVGELNLSASPLVLTAITGGAVTIPTGTTIPARGYVVLQSAGATNFTPGTGETAVPITGLGKPGNPSTTTGHEIVLVRPRRQDGTFTSSSVVDNTYQEETASTPNLDQMVPVDSIDLNGVFASGTAGRRVYERAHGETSATVFYNWDFVYPGSYDPSNASATMPSSNQTGWGALVSPPGLPVAGAVVSDGTTAGGANPVVITPMQMATGTAAGTWVGANPAVNIGGASPAVPNKFPFAAFARNGDILKVPFIGAYVVHGPNPGGGGAAPIIAMNAISMDASQADVYTSLKALGYTTLATAERVDEAIGRFVPLAAIDPSLAASTYKGTTSNGVTTVHDPYGWAAKIFDYVDVQVSNDDDFPNVDPRLTDGSNVDPTAVNYANGAGTNPPRYPYNTGGTAATLATGVASQTSATGFTNGTFEQSVGKQGLININTAPAFVLTQLPGFAGTGLAAAIVADRTANGPFKTIFDLNRVTGFQTDGTTYTFDNNLAHDIGLAGGDFTPGPTTGSYGGYDGVRSDFEEKTLMLNRISNLITTRSDTFTCYVELQGWRNAGTANATLAVQRRAAFILDRTNVTASNSKPQMITVPNP